MWPDSEIAFNKKSIVIDESTVSSCKDILSYVGKERKSMINRGWDNSSIDLLRDMARSLKNDASASLKVTVSNQRELKLA